MERRNTLRERLLGDTVLWRSQIHKFDEMRLNNNRAQFWTTNGGVRLSLCGVPLRKRGHARKGGKVFERGKSFPLGAVWAIWRSLAGWLPRQPDVLAKPARRPAYQHELSQPGQVRPDCSARRAGDQFPSTQGSQLASGRAKTFPPFRFSPFGS